MSVPGAKARKVIAKTRKFCIETTFSHPLVIKTGYGCFLEDIDGNLFLDFTSNICSCNVGYNHPAIMRVLEEYSRIGAHKIAGQDFYTEEQAKLAEKLVKITPKNLRKVFLVNSGAEAVENAIKLAFRKKGPLPGIACTGAFHGRTLGALSFTDLFAVHKKNFPEINHELIKFCTRDDDPDIEQLEKIIEREAEPAFVIVECVQENGYIVASRKFIKTLRKVTRKYNVPLIIDEVQTGIGRTGKWWGFEHFKIKPDIIAAAKGLQVGAVVSSRKYDPKERGVVSSTWGGGHRIDMAVALKTIEIIEKEKLLKNASKMGKFMMKWLKEIWERYPEKIVDVRGLGLMIGVEFSNVRRRDEVVKEAFKRNLVLLGCGFKTVRIAPPLVISEREAEHGLQIFEEVVEELK
ncbi:MAG TPA: aminotransferase class III-fold pyridoxal phosphate-dependent enzyme [Candidatus Aenigmarchaeota archaeon]|nr:aminotransferase class III-fold pyridoxal phosphate-dependent enzyme [Candidatus Aenigmarchaeota archaeon]